MNKNSYLGIDMKIAIVSPGALPVPAVDGGAVEVLTTYIIEGNEKSGDFDIDLYTVASNKLDNFSYKYTTIKQMKMNCISSFIHRMRNIICY